MLVDTSLWIQNDSTNANANENENDSHSTHRQVTGQARGGYGPVRLLLSHSRIAAVNFLCTHRLKYDLVIVLSAVAISNRGRIFCDSFYFLGNFIKGLVSKYPLCLVEVHHEHK